MFLKAHCMLYSPLCTAPGTGYTTFCRDLARILDFVHVQKRQYNRHQGELVAHLKSYGVERIESILYLEWTTLELLCDNVVRLE